MIIRLTIIIIFQLLFQSCSSKKSIIEKSNDVQFLSKIIENYMLNCTDSNDLKTHMKSKYNPKDSTISFYIGNSIYDYYQKWNIPLQEIEIEIDNTNSEKLLRELKIKGINNKSVIKYYENGIQEIENLDYLVIYLFNWCDKNEQKNFIAALKRITELNKSN